MIGMARNFGYFVGKVNADRVKVIKAIKQIYQVNCLTWQRGVIGCDLVGASRHTLFGLSLEVAAS